jgi:hypothetical protein
MRTATYFALRDQKRGSGQVEQKNQNYFKGIYTPFYYLGQTELKVSKLKYS